jgi:DNA polymerase elongation subunit (family B)
VKFYTSFHQSKGKILVRGYDNGRPFKEKVAYKPYLFIPTEKKNTKYKTLDGQAVEKFQFESINDARDFVRQYEDVENFKVYGMTNFPYVYIYDTYPGEIKFNPDWIKVGNIDIEVLMKNGIGPDVIEQARDEVTLITLRNGGKSYVFAKPPEAEFGKFYPDRETERDVIYKEFRSEYDMFDAFLTKFNELGIDVITGWNVELFDVVYLVNRITRVMGDEEAKRLSPWKMLEQRTIEIFGKEQTVYMPVGVAVLDMLQLYKKFTYTQQESYKLDYICSVELGEKKLDYSEYDGLNDLYTKNWAKYVRYNIHDTILVERLNDKMKLLELVYTLAFDAKCTFNDTMATVRPWDVIIHNFMMERGLVVPQFVEQDFRPYEGGYVKEPVPGAYRWVMSFDVTSEYPSLIMQYNLSPEKLLPGMLPWNAGVDEILNGLYDRPEVRDYFVSRNAGAPAGGYLFSNEKQGIMPEIVQRIFDDRVRYKNLMKDAKKKFEASGSREDENEVARYNNLQMAKKIQLNSLYGAMANKYFRWFRLQIAESITLSGQMTIRWAERAVNKYLNMALKTDNVDYVIAADTDSLYVCFDKLVALVFGDKQDDKQKIVDFLDKVANEKIQKVLDRAFDELKERTNAFQQKIFMKREAIADLGLWTGKKRYVLNVYDLEGLRYKEPKVKMTGIEAVRSTTPAVCRDAIKKSIEMMLTKTEDELFDYVEDFRRQFYRMRFEDVARPSGVKGLTKYADKYNIYEKGCPIHVRAALLYNHHLKENKLEGKYNRIQEGEKIRHCYLTLPNPIRENVIACINSFPNEFGLEPYIDYEQQFDKVFFEPVKSMSDLLGWDLVRRNTLDDFFA